MIRLDKLYDPIQDKDLPSLRPLLHSLQGNILRGHGRDRSIHLFLHFKTGKAREVKEKLRIFADRVTSAQQQHEEAEEYRKYKIPGSLFCNFFLAAAGYRYLGLDLTGYNQAFIEGMKGARKRLLDPPAETWETGYQQEIHAMVLLADDDKDFLLREARKVFRSFLHSTH